MTATFDFIDEDAVEEMVNEQLDYRMEDHGIGEYEFWGTKNFDTNEIPSLTTDTVVVQYPVVRDQGIWVSVRGRKEIEEHDVYWVAELNKVEWNREQICYDAEYSITEE